MYYINSPLEQFEINLFLGINTPFFNITYINITSFALYTIIVITIILSIHILLLNNQELSGSKWLIVQELIYDTIILIVKNIINGKKWGLYFPLIYTFFIYIFISNLISLVPYSFALTSNFIFIISLSFTVWIGVTLLGLYNHGIRFFGLFVPQNTPIVLIPLLVIIELLSYIARAISLGLRLSVNNCAGHLLIAILSGLLFNLISLSVITFIIGFIPILVILGIYFLELAIGLIQAYVWSILTSSYLKDLLYLH